MSSTFATATAITPTVWDVVLFPAPTTPLLSAGTQLSARAAFQAALHERVVVVDLRDAAERRASGEIAATLDPQHVPAAELADWLVEVRGEWDRVVLLSGRGIRSDAARRWLNRRFPQLDIVDVRGGFLAWAREGMPTSGG